MIKRLVLFIVAALITTVATAALLGGDAVYHAHAVMTHSSAYATHAIAAVGIAGTVRGKLKLTSITHHCWSQHSKLVRFETQYDNSIPEDQRFAVATPSGHMELQIDNPAALAQLEIGKDYYVDLTPVPEPVPAASPQQGPAVT